MGLRINIGGDCFINQAWTGETEIHQFTDDGRDSVQKLDLRDYVLEDVTLQYRYDGDLLIPLKAGDYVIYYPNEHYTEMPVRSGDKVTIGMIFYYLDELDLADYDLTIQFHRTFTQGWSFIAFVVAAVLWLLSSVVYITSVFIYRNARKQMELRRSGLSYMSELYEAIYIVNLPTGETTPVSTGEYLEELRAKYSNTKELLYAAVRDDADDSYLDEALEFVNTDTLADRLKDRESLVYEFVSKVHGWCRFRFFAMERTEGKPLENVIFAVQDINDERSEATKLTDRLRKVESSVMANSSFLSDASRDLQAPVRKLLSLDEEIMRETDPEQIRSHAESIHEVADRMMTLINGLTDRAAAEAGRGENAAERYSLKQLVTETLRTVRPMAEENRIRLEPEVSENIPDALIGDFVKLKEVAVSLLANAVNHSADGNVKLSVFGRILSGTVHLLFSVRFSPENEEPSGIRAGRKAAQADPDLDLEIAGSLLSSMNSELKSVRSADAWKETYFEIDQQIAEPVSTESIAAEDMKR